MCKKKSTDKLYRYLILFIKKQIELVNFQGIKSTDLSVSSIPTNGF